MKKRMLISLLAFAIASAAFGAAGTRLCPVQVKGQAAGTEAADSMLPVQQFGYGLLAQHLDEKDPVLSPVSAYLTLCMAGNGAKGATQKEFQKVLGGDMLSVPGALMDIGGTQLTIANSAWLDKKFTAKKEWLKTAESLFGADVYRAALDTDATKDKINQWVSKQTNKKIPKLLSKKLDKGTSLALLNALYFHADWMQEFPAENTRKSEFRLDSGETKETDMMYAKISGCGYFKDDASEGVVLPYKDSSLAFVAVKPTGDESIRDWYASYTAREMAALIKSRTTEKVDLGLVKFTARCRLDLKGSLKKMGIKKAFDRNKADFSLLGKSKGGENLYLGMVLQETMISVAETGTEGAAVTVAGIMPTSAMPEDQPTVVRFDRPFLYMVMDMESGAQVFMGIVDQPGNE